MSPREREREYARRRYEGWQQRQAAAARARQRRRRTLTAVVAGIVAAATAVIVALFVLVPDGAGQSGGEEAAAAPSPGAEVADPCPAPTSTPPAEPAQFEAAPPPEDAQARTWTASIATSCGEITVELDGAAAPAAVSSFVFLAGQDYFAGTSCHRLTTAGISVLQCGDPTGTGTGGPGYSFGPVENAPGDDVYPAGTLAMARQGGDGSSMGSQFFLVYADSQIPSDQAGGYTVFGRVTGGLDVVERVAAAGVGGGGSDGAPATPISIEGVTAQ